MDALAVRNADGSTSPMVTSYATASTTDNNGSASPRTVFVNLAAVGTFTSATEVDFNAATSPTTGPIVTTITPVATPSLTFTGYGSSMLLLKR